MIDILRAWTIWRALAVAAGWIIAGSLVIWIYAYARVTLARRNAPLNEPFFYHLSVPGAPWIVLGPPLLLLAAWLWIRLFRPAT